MLRKKYIKSSRDIRKIPYDLVSELVILRDYADTSEAYLNEEHKLLVDLADGLYNNGWIDEIVSKMKSTYPEIFDKYGDDYFELILDDCSAIDSQIRPNNVQDLIDEYTAKADEFVGIDVDVESATDVCSSKMYELSPKDGRKSFYGKAKVMLEDDGSETLYSYGTPIIRRKPNGDLDPLWDGYSATTGRHIASFAGLNKKQYMDLLKKKQGVESATDVKCASGDDIVRNVLELTKGTWFAPMSEFSDIVYNADEIIPVIDYDSCVEFGTFNGQELLIYDIVDGRKHIRYSCSMKTIFDKLILTDVWDSTGIIYKCDYDSLWNNLEGHKDSVESAEKIECVGHNDPGRYFDLVDYYDVWADEDGGWQVNDVSIIERDIWISDDTTEEVQLYIVSGD